MAADLKDLVKPPFANYDVVVYFGCGLFALPLIKHYVVEPTGLRFPSFNFDIGLEIAGSAISVLSLLFSVYLLGHIISYCSSLFIEKAINTFFGKTSSAILLSTWSQSKDRPELRKAWRASRRRKAFRKGCRTQNILRTLAVAPAIPLVWIVNLTGGFDFYHSRIPRAVIFKARKKLSDMGYGPVGLNDPWYKTLEHVVINRYPATTARMYNYLVISGIFRSLSFLFLACLWMQIYYAAHGFIHDDMPVKALLSDEVNIEYQIIAFSLLYIVLGFSLASYMKFARRYAEEAIFAFVLAEEERV